ncbi:universal stress protein [Paracoccus sp. (in: a-proteobacteria)]|uniref:universal stress protein n=1 Tax=Paracoccus sp. TaxID=267 RepID=UPI0026DF9AEB|nr:universal stress protein [Paracoccus sp. (in: a-proteobacteria)]MDO5646944.1 universal stress protein [Paracoccus sp. (in: a-proteobacteria)]
MPRKFLVGFDGSESAQRTLDFAIERAKAQGDSILIAHVLEWSPYSFLTQSELAERHARRAQELERAKTAVLDPMVEKIRAAGVPVTTVLKYGNIAETLVDIATEENASMIFIGRTGHSAFANRFFGSVAGTLAQVAPVPVVIVP